jgi:hypothetical protein
MDNLDFEKELEGMAEYEIEAMRQAENSGGGVRLPFPALFIHVKNGDQKLRGAAASTPSLYFGGWEADAGQVAELIDAGVVTDTLKTWAAYDGVSGSKTWDAVGARQVAVSYIAKRERWISKDGQSWSPKYDEGHSRRHLQVLVSLYENRGYYCPAILTAKGFQVSEVLNAFGVWDKAMAPLKKEINATSFPRGAFWLEIGTEGERPNFKTVGKPGSENMITPMTAVGADKLTADKLRKRYVGREILAANVRMLTEAKDWLAAWSEQRRLQPPAAEAPAGELTYTDY